MPDITACVNKSCEQRMSCYRYRTVWSDRWQSVSLFKNQMDGCRYFYPCEESDRLVLEDEADQRASYGGEGGKDEVGT